MRQTKSVRCFAAKPAKESRYLDSLLFHRVIEFRESIDAGGHQLKNTGH
ncbi:MAG: hypothetical protein OXC57_01595 [Rhodobacteraceae bacterium]|nr:hypothetical protein [Paracoccaceae bacterium]